VFVGKIFDDGFAVIAERRQLDALLFKSCDGSLQLDQLPFAVRSPVGGTEYQQNGSVRPFQGFESLHISKLVARGKIGRLLPDLQSN
jgi:hypothetical protein